MSETLLNQDIDIRSKFGYSYMIEFNNLKEEIATEKGLSKTDPWVYFEAMRRYEENHKNDLTYRQKSEARKTELNDNILLSLNKSDIEYLIEKLFGVNDDQGLFIRQKLKNISKDCS